MLVSSFSLTHEHPIPQPSPAIYHDGPVFRACSSAMQRPTLTSVRIRSTRDANSIFYAVARNLLPMTVRRLDAEERRAIASGNVYVWEERGSSSEATGLGIERWTDGMRWSPSRVRDEFLFYHQKEMDPEEAAELPPTRWARIVRPKASGSDAYASDASPDRIPSQSSSNDPERLIKQTYSVLVDFPEDRHRGGALRKWHLTAYFTQATVEELSTVDEVLPLPRVPVPEGLFRSARAGKNRRDTGRQRPSMGQAYDHPVAGPSTVSPSISMRGEQPMTMIARPSLRMPVVAPNASHVVFPRSHSAGDMRMHIDPPQHPRGPYPLPAVDKTLSSRQVEVGLSVGLEEASSRYRVEQHAGPYGADGVVYVTRDANRATPPLPPLRTSTTSLAHSRMHSPIYTHHPYLSSPRPLSRGGAITPSPKQGTIQYTQAVSPSFSLNRQPYPSSPHPDSYVPEEFASDTRHPRHISSIESLHQYSSRRELVDPPRHCDFDEGSEVSPVQRESEVGPARGSGSTPSPLRSRRSSLARSVGPALKASSSPVDVVLPVSPVSIDSHQEHQEVSSIEKPRTRASSPFRVSDEDNSKGPLELSPQPSPSSLKVNLPPLTTLAGEQMDPEKNRLLVPLNSLDGATYPRRDPTDDALLRRFHALKATAPALAVAPGAGEE